DVNDLLEERCGYLMVHICVSDGRHVDVVSIRDRRDRGERDGGVEDLVGRDVLRIDGGDRRIAVHDQDPVGVRIGDGLDGDVVPLVVVGGALDLERGHQTERLDGPANDSAGAGSDDAYDPT